MEQGLSSKAKLLKELTAEREKLFERTRDDPKLNKLLEEKVRRNDPMAHLVKKKISGRTGSSKVGRK
jgi:hypothetical protein